MNRLCQWFNKPTQAWKMIEVYRQGPTQTTRWQFLRWRITFPLFTLFLTLFHIGLGQLSSTLYLFTACPLWYTSHFILSAYPYFLLYRYKTLEGQCFQPFLWKVFLFTSVIISGIEYLFLSELPAFSYLIGNTLYGCIGCIAIPCFFYFQTHRCIREQKKEVDEDEQQSSCNSSNFTSNQNEENIGINIGRRISSPLLPRMRGTMSWEEEEGEEDMPKWIHGENRQPKTAVLYASALSLCAVSVISGMAYLSPDLRNVYWSWLYFLAPLPLLIFVTERHRSFRYNFPYLIFYGVVVVHVPNYIGHFALTIFSGETSNASTTSVIKFGASLLFLVLMQGYFYVLGKAVRNMSEAYAHPSLLYIGQMYYYIFWYMLVSDDAPIDILYVGLLFLNNIHIVLANTGVYMDLWGSAGRGLRGPMMGCIGASIALCPRKDPELPWTRKRSKSELPSAEEVERDQIRSLFFLMKMAEQDNMADTSALILVPTLLTILSLLDAPQGAQLVFSDKINMWMRCIIMFIGRIGSSYLAQEIFAYKLKSQTTRNENDASSAKNVHFRIQSIMLHDFQSHFWYLIIVTIVCTFAVFDRIECPPRFAFLSTAL